MNAGRSVETPRDTQGRVDYNVGWKIWTDMNRYYPSVVHRRRLIASWIVPLRPASVLDAGCGTGTLLDQLRPRLPGARLAGVDQASEQMATNRVHMPWAEFWPLDLCTQALDRRFDVVICSEVLEHVEDDESALDHLAAMSGRYLLLTVPRGNMYPLEAGFGHLRHYEIASLCRRIEQRGLKIVRATAWGFPFMTAFKWAANVNPKAISKGFADGAWSLSKKALGRLLTGLFYLNVPGRGPQILVLAKRPG